MIILVAPRSRAFAVAHSTIADQFPPPAKRVQIKSFEQVCIRAGDPDRARPATDPSRSAT